MLLYAHGRGGVGASGVAVVVQLVPAALVAPVAAFAGDRFRRDRVVVAGHGAQALTCLAVGAVMAADAPVVAVYVAGAATSIVMTFSRPALAALLPQLATTPAELAKANVTVGVAQCVGTLAGPLIAGLLLVVVSPSGVFVFGAAAAALAFLATALVVVEPPPTTRPITMLDVHRSTLAGLRLLHRSPGPRMVVALLGASAVVIGAADLAAIAVAIDVLKRGDLAVGTLTAAVGLGAVAGSFGSRTFIVARRPGLVLTLGMALQGVAMVLVASASRPATAMAAFFAVGFGIGFVIVGGQSLLHTITPDAVMTRVFGIVEGLRMAALAAGSMGVAAIGHWVGTTSAVAVIGSVVVGASGAASPMLRRLDVHAAETGAPVGTVGASAVGSAAVGSPGAGSTGAGAPVLVAPATR
jgi:hypothetical protein